MTATILTSPSAETRLARAERWLADRPRGALLVGASLDAARQLARRAAVRSGAGFGWHASTVARLAAGIAAPALAEAGKVAAAPLGLEAVCARALHRMREEGTLGRLEAIADRPGLPAALLRTLTDLRLARIIHGPTEYERRAASSRRSDEGAYSASVTEERRTDAPQIGGQTTEAHEFSGPTGDVALRLPAEVSAALAAYREELTRARLADRAEVLALAAARLPARLAPLLLLDVEIGSAAEGRFVAALAGRAAEALCTVPSGDERSLAALREIMPGAVVADAGPPPALGRLADALFVDGAAAVPDGDLVLLSAPGESRECVEIARRARAEAGRGVRWDQMAILLRSPATYRTGLEEALRRASIPAHFAAGTRRPDPAGRAFLSLLACAAEGLAARRFAEYLSLGEVPGEGGDPDVWVPVDDEIGPDEGLGEREGTAFATPRRWERLLVDAAVIGGRDRWRRRLAGLEERMRLALAQVDDPDGEEAGRLMKTLGELERLRAFALPLLDALAGLPAAATWGAWLQALEQLAGRALRRPERVLAVLAELRPMAEVGPVGLAEVRLVLRRRLSEAAVPPPSRPPGRLLVAPIEAARGLSFEVVFLPGLAEKLFPPKLGEDPLLPDELRARLGLAGGPERLAAERLRLRLATGAAARRLVASYPRLDLENGRARVPSLYALELCRARDGRLPGFEELARQAELEGGARAGWPAPPDAGDAIDDAEHDLATLQKLKPERGAARYLVEANEHLAASLRARYRRHQRKWTSADGLVEAGPEARAALEKHLPATRAYSATGLRRLAVCPYQFYLGTVLKLAPRETPEPIEEMDPLERGSLVHEIMFRVSGTLRDAGMLPVTDERLAQARAVVDRTVDEVGAEYRDRLYPAIARVWDDGIAAIRADLHEWLARAAGERDWVPWRFELAFGLARRGDDGRDPGSTDEAVALDNGILLHGAIDLVERGAGGVLRVTDYKTGKARAQRGQIIAGGQHLQPVLYALALEKLFPGAEVRGGRLYYCTTAGGFTSIETRLDEDARRAAGMVGRAVAETVSGGRFPAAPDHRACQFCEYAAVCGPEAAERADRKGPIQMLIDLRGMR